MRKPVERAIVVGASSGIGAAVSREIVRRGGSVVGIARRADRLTTMATELNEAAGSTVFVPIVHDVLKTDEAVGLLQESARLLGGLDTLIYSSGILRSLADDDAPLATDDTLAMIDVNVKGGIAWCDAAANRFAKLGEGRIVGIGSIAGDRGRRGNPGYGTSKGALGIYLEGLRNRLEIKGVSITTIKPGFIDTAMVAAIERKPLVVSAEKAAAQIVNATERRAGTVYVPTRWRFVSMILRSVPSFLFRRLSV